MTIQFTCPECGKRYKVADAAAGKRVKCKGCGHPLRVPIKEPLLPEDDFKGALGSSNQRVAASPNLPLLVGIGTVGVLLVVGTVFWLLRGEPGERQRPSDEQVTATDDSGNQERTAATKAEGEKGLSAGQVGASGARPQQAEAATTVRTSGKAQGAVSANSVARRNLSFPDAVTKRPAWTSIGPAAPFDVDKYFESPLPEQNAAPLYLDALVEFGMLDLFSPEERKRRYPIVKQRRDEYVRLDRAWRKDPASVDKAAVDAWLAQYDVGVEKLALAQQRPECVFETGIGIAVLLPHAQAAREVALVVEWRARNDLARGDVERPVQDLETVLRLSRDLQPRGQPISQLVGVAMDAICCERIVSKILRADGLNQKHCDRLLAVLDRHETGSRLRFHWAMQTEYLEARKALHDFQHHTGDFSADFLTRMGLADRPLADTPLGYLKVLIDLGGGGTGPLAKEKYGKGAVGLAPDHPLVAGWTADGKLMSDDDFAKEVEALNRVYASILDSADRTAGERLRVSRDSAVVEPLRHTNVALLFEPRWEQLVFALVRAETKLRGTKCLIALRRWQLDHDGPPPDLETMVKAAGMSEVPTDPYSDQPMLMTAVDGRPVIYSVGPDGKDDRALVEWNGDTRNLAGDVLFRLPVPQ